MKRSVAFILFDLVIRLLPNRVRHALLNSTVLAIWAKDGGKRRSIDRVRAMGLEGKWIESAECHPQDENTMARQLMTSLIDMKARQAECASMYLPSHEWQRLLDNGWKRPLEHLRNGEVTDFATFLRNFFRNEAISGFWGTTHLFESFAREDRLSELAGEYEVLREIEVLSEFSPGWSAEALDAPRVGNPWGYRFRGALIYPPVCEYYLQAEYLTRLVSSKDRPVICEIGGGFGGLASHLLKRNPRIHYVGFDLPENALLQSYYLKCAFPGLRIYLYERSFSSLTKEMLNSYDVFLLPNFCLPQVQPDLVDLVVNIRSMSEMSQDTIAEYCRQIERMQAVYFFHENVFKERGDGLHGIPSPRFPVHSDYRLIHSGPSRWPKYKADSLYPCHENLFQHCSAAPAKLR